jgi:DNA polymerase-3 subunit beta
MQFICDRDSFNRELGLVCRVIPAKPTHPILANVLIEADANRQKVALTAFDLSTAIKLELQTEVIDGGKITLPGKLLSDTLSGLDGEEFMLIVDELNPQTEAQLAFIKGESSQATLESIKAEEYPSLPIINSTEGCSLNLSIATLRKGLQGTLFAASTDETKQVLQGIHLSAVEAAIEFAFTDGHRLAVVNLSHQIVSS